MSRTRAAALLMLLAGGTRLGCGPQICHSDAECEPGEFCKGDQAWIGEGCAHRPDGECTPRLGRGEPCDELDPGCEAGLLCNGALPSTRCVAPLPLGSPCFVDAHCADATAEDGPVCHRPERHATGTCASPHTAGPGEPCEVPRACAHDLVCLQSSCE